ncbi:MAG TPA: amino acid adenylation domain-containing protein [Pyrinomonadaceae bacterium]|nr:amino acid adenylation domain-containing protein [Pyrinomonadaceae bacterium]
MKTVTPSRHYIHEAFEAQVERSLDRIAVVFEGRNLTFKQLNTRANQVAHVLRKRGVGPEVLVGVCCERSLELIVGILGILKAGGAYVPIDPSFPSERISFILEDTKVAMILTHREKLEKLRDRVGDIPFIGLDATEAEQDCENLPCDLRPENLAYVVYTSGSTGAPKGVMTPHGAVCNYLSWMIEAFDLSQSDRFVQKAPITFDPSVWEIFLPLSLGTQLVLAKPGGERDNPYLVKLIAHEAISVIQFVPSLLRLFLQQESLEAMCGSLKHVFSGGEVLSIDLQKRFFNRLPSARLHNLYGPTETTIFSTCWSCQPTSDYRIVPIGKPIKSTTVQLLDQNLQPTPLGDTGEIYIGGAGLARGYLNRPELTLKNFIVDPFNQGSADCLYKTGDLARFLPDGNLEFLGRKDHQVKIRGIRIELQEIEGLLSQHPDVKSNVVVANEVTPGEKRLIAYVAINAGSMLTTSDLRAYLSKTLPDYMLPSTWILMESLPLNVHGKVDRHALPAPSNERPSVREAFVEAQNEIEVQLKEIWEDLLGIRPIGVRDNFFELGGDSLLATQLLIRVQDVFNRAIPPSSLIEEPTIEHLARNVGSPIDESTFSSLVRIQTNGSKPPLFFVHPIGGEVLGYRAMAGHLGSDQPFYGLRARGLDGRAEPQTNIESMASEYIKEIRNIQLEGPFYLGGYSSGGVIAFEMAQQLKGLGLEVAFLAIVDEEAPRIGDQRSLDTGLPVRFALDLPFWLVDHVLRRPSREVFSDIRRNLRKISKRTFRSVFKSRSQQIFPADVYDEIDLTNLSEHTLKVVEATYEGLIKYRPRVYDGPMSLFRTRATSLFHSHTRDKGWGNLTSSVVEIFYVPGNHPHLLDEPHAFHLAGELSKALEKFGAHGFSRTPRKLDLITTAHSSI